MATSFPTNLDTFTTKINNVTIVDASHVNSLQDSVIAMQEMIHRGFFNLFNDGGFQVWQGLTDDTGVTTTRKYVPDAWAFKTGAGTLANVRRTTNLRPTYNTDLVRSKYSCELIGAAGVTTVTIDQRIEAARVGRYKGTIFFNGWIYNNTGAAFTPKIYASTPTAEDNWATSNIRNGGGAGESLQSCSDAGWTLVSWSGDASGYTDINNGLEIRIEIPSGSLVAGDTVRFSEFNLTPLVDTPFIPLDFEIELYRCMRRFQKSFAYATAPAQNIGVNTGEFVMLAHAAGAVTQRSYFVPFPVVMAADPTTLTRYNPAAANANVRDETAAADCGAIIFASNKARGFRLEVTGNAATAPGNILGVHWTADCRL